MVVSTEDLKAEFDKYIEQLGHGEELVIVSGGREIARMVPTPATRPRVAAETEAEAIERLRSQPWIRPGRGPLTLPAIVTRILPGEKTLAEIVSEQRG